MAKDITIDFNNLGSKTPHSGHDRLNNSKAMSNTKITKECVDKLIENIDKTLRKSE
ncbi:hypothetical protein ACQKII_17270 [Lysinibacillus sp. NPDC048646]|uniref:hypothetical protein n=1 Tax=Lysinibacillus sp. NPDC048646 TaxID=3390574 RepID=UPI003CFF76C1